MNELRATGCVLKSGPVGSETVAHLRKYEVVLPLIERRTMSTVKDRVCFYGALFLLSSCCGYFAYVAWKVLGNT